jgi:hypothetical protein
MCLQAYGCQDWFVPVQPTINGASPEQRILLAEILAGLASTRITEVALQAGDHGREIFVTVDDIRGRWEAELLATAFARRSKAAGLPKVSVFASLDGSQTLEWAPPPVDLLADEAVARFRAEVVDAAGDAPVETFDVLRPQGHAVALGIHAGEPHAFLRFRSRDFLQTVAEWREQCDGIYGEIRDDQSGPALAFGWFRGGGFSSTRGDVECCAPFLGMSHAIDWQRPPPCPVFG